MQTPTNDRDGEDASGVYAKRFDTGSRPSATTPDTATPDTATPGATTALTAKTGTAKTGTANAGGVKAGTAPSPKEKPVAGRSGAGAPTVRRRRVAPAAIVVGVVLVVVVGLATTMHGGRAASSKFDSVARAICGPRLVPRSPLVVTPGVVGPFSWGSAAAGGEGASAAVGCGGGAASGDIAAFPSAASAASSGSSSGDSGGGQPGGSGGGPSPAVASPTDPKANAASTPTGFGSGAVGAAPPSPGPAAAGHSFVSTATMTVMVEGDTAKAVAAQKRAAAAIVATAGGGLFGEESSFDGEAKATITFKVPSSEFTKVLDQLGELGAPKSQEVKTDEVTGQVIDLEAKVTAAANGLQRAKDLLAKAISPSDVAQVEADVARRETELETLRGQQAALNQRVELSTIVLTLVSSAPVVAPPPPPAVAAATPPPGFFDGLGAGWNVFAKVGTFVLAGVGAVLPFLPVVLVVAVPWWLLRRRSRSRLTPAGTAGAPAPS